MARDEFVSPLDKIMPISRWTKISHDDKVMTHLVNLFWIWDTTLSHLIDRDLFLYSLTGTECDTAYSEYGHFCSPLLVNAILAVASLHATRNTSEANSADILALGHQFANHAFQLLESEQTVSSLTLLQAAAVLWTYASNDGSHHARRQCASLQSLLRQNWVSVDLDGIGSRLVTSLRKNDGAPAKMCQAISHMTWGFYCFFSKASVIASPEMLVPKPLISNTSRSFSSQVYCMGQNPILYPGKAPRYSEAFAAECALCEIAARFVTESACNGLDGCRYTALYNKLCCWQLSFPDHLMTDESVSSTVLLLQASYDFIALRIMSSYLKDSDTDVFDGHNAASLIIGHASSMMASLWTYRGIHKIRHEYWAAEYCSFMVHELMHLLDLGNAKLTVRDIIGKACCIINEMSNAGVSGRAQAILINIEKQAKLSNRIVPVYKAP
ncbi:hypothetical protein CNYM01_13891 [Colletotrichum nymphaeae SA-01]|uniref:Transcription factor domain-containing protein n=1 Tax=Colletotrichum nymphaeae SA-01 TaxID=1460502 RepID=A0A135UJE0_9PEZI|nr:hypothetical protein CNYM01_13891 [Colletotrichum nymphaeae SA-01]